MLMRLRTDEGCDAQPFLLWDTVWDATRSCGTWLLAGFSAVRNAGGLRATAALETAIILQLFTDRRCPPTHPLAARAAGDPRGWWGDVVAVRTDLGETELGSLLWLLQNGVADADTLRWAQSMAQDALAPILAQGAAVRADVSATALAACNGYALDLVLYGRYGGKVYDRRFEIVWTQIGPQ